MKVQYLLPAQEVDMGGIPILQPLPTQRVQQIDPFLLLHHHTATVRAGSPPLGSGIGPHPHRGFMPVTFILLGDLHHRDSLGNSQVISAGGTQWTFAGRGIIHSERPSAELAENGGTQELIQIWINVPSAQKMNPAKYLSTTAEQATTWSEGGNTFHLHSGKLLGKDAPLSTPYPVTSMHAKVGLEGFSLKAESGHAAILYTLSGELHIEGHGLIEPRVLVAFQNEGKEVKIKAKEGEAEFLFLSAPPIDEEVTTWGPYVMTTQTEIMEALRDFQMGKMGVLVEE